MSRQPLRDENSAIIGYIEEVPSAGWVRLLDRGFKTLGWYDPARQITTDAGWRVLGR